MIGVKIVLMYDHEILKLIVHFQCVYQFTVSELNLDRTEKKIN